MNRYELEKQHWFALAKKAETSEIALTNQHLNSKMNTSLSYGDVAAIVRRLDAEIARADLAEARLAKAVEALRDVRVFGVITHTALAVLAEIEGGKKDE